MNIKTANRLCDLRKKNGLSQEELASKLGVSRQAVSKWERSESSPDIDNLIELAKLYGISLDDLLNGDDDTINIIKENKKSDEEAETISSDDEGNTISLGKGKIIFSDENEKVVIQKDKVIVTRKDGTTKEMSKDMWKERMLYRRHPIAKAISSCWGILIVIAYIVLGFVLPNNEGWKNYWFLFILLPFIPSLFAAIYKKKATDFCYPCVVTALYCALGVFLNAWHPAWVVFITIPVYYMIASGFDSHIKRDDEFDYFNDDEEE